MRRYRVSVAGQRFTVDIAELDAERFEVRLDGQSYEVRLEDAQDLAGPAVGPAMVVIDLPAPPEAAIAPPPRSAPSAPAGPAAGPESLTAPMPGTVVSVDVAAGQAVARGQVLVVLEAMKMNNSIRAARDAVVAEVLVARGQAVGYGEALIRFAEGAGR